MVTSRSPRSWQAGVTQAEMLAVIAILAVTAALAMPQADQHSSLAAELAAGDIAQALRFAQREAVRTGVYHTISIDPASQVLRITRPAASGNTIVNAIHPVDKRDYQINFAKDGMPHATIVSSVFRYQSNAVTTGAIFGPDGVPVDVAPTKVLGLPLGIVLGTKEISPLKEEARITLRYGGVERVVRVAPVTGRVSL